MLFVFLFGELVMHLWNWLLPALFGWHPIGFWQALGLLVLCRILFGGFGGHGAGHSKNAASVGRALGADDAGRTREVSARWAWTLRRFRRSQPTKPANRLNDTGGGYRGGAEESS